MKPMLKYRGGKSKEIPHIIRFLPVFKGRYIEPFFGGGALFFYLEPDTAIINDINTPLMGFYQSVRDNYLALRAELDLIETIYYQNRKRFEELKTQFPDKHIKDGNEEFYYCLRDMYNGIAEKQYSDALLYYFINKTAYSGMIRYNSKGEFNVPFGRYKNLNTKTVSLEHSLLLQKTSLYNGDYSAIFELSQNDDFIFLDPPYDCVFSDYGNEIHKDGFMESNHRKLAQDFRNLGCPALMVIGKTPLTEDLYKSFIVAKYDKKYAVNIRNRFKAEASHLIIVNYQL